MSHDYNENNYDNDDRTNAENIGNDSDYTNGENDSDSDIDTDSDSDNENNNNNTPIVIN